MLNMCCANILFHSFSSMLCTRKQNAEGKSCMLLEVFIKIYNMLIFCCNVCTSSITYGSAFIRPPPPPHFEKHWFELLPFPGRQFLSLHKSGSGSFCSHLYAPHTHIALLLTISLFRMQTRLTRVGSFRSFFAPCIALWLYSSPYTIQLLLPVRLNSLWLDDRGQEVSTCFCVPFSQRMNGSLYELRFAWTPPVGDLGIISENYGIG